MAPRGKPTSIDAAVRERMVAWREAGWSLARIAEQLNADGVPTPRDGGTWYAQSVRQVVEAERRRRTPTPAGADEVRELRLIARGVDTERFEDLAQAVRCMAACAGAAEVEVTVT
ncbi:MAG TPA: recombinase family protein [Sporichthyaceae bacterium]|jgi:hypothetical protein